MLRRFLPVALVLVSLCVGAPAAAHAAPACQFILGFKTLHDLDPVDVGDCVDDQAFAANGDAQQRTTKGLMAWRKADNWTAFTNGYATWINGPSGLQRRLNSVRFSWEADPEELPVLGTAGQLVLPPIPAVPSAFAPLADPVGSAVDWRPNLGGDTSFHAVVKAAYRAALLPTVYYASGDVEHGPVYAPGNSAFAVFVLTVTNTGNASGTIYDNDLVIRDAQGRTFTSDQTPDGAFISLKDRLRTKGVADALGPSLTDTFALVYVVAPDSTGLRLAANPIG